MTSVFGNHNIFQQTEQLQQHQKPLQHGLIGFESFISKIGLAEMPPEELQDYLWNCDETVFCSAQACSKILARRGDKNVQETIGGSGREYFTVLAAGSAGGEILPPYLSTKRKTSGLSGCMQGGPDGSHYTVSDSGWMEAANFFAMVQENVCSCSEKSHDKSSSGANL